MQSIDEFGESLTEDQLSVEFADALNRIVGKARRIKQSFWSRAFSRLRAIFKKEVV